MTTFWIIVFVIVSAFVGIKWVEDIKNGGRYAEVLGAFMIAGAIFTGLSRLFL